MSLAKLYNLARMTTGTVGTGPLTLGAAVDGHLTFAQAGVVNGDTVYYAINDGSQSEVGTGVYTAVGTTLSRTVIKSTNADAAISLSGDAEVMVTALAESFREVLDFVDGQGTWGDIIYRGQTGWQRLAAGTSGFFLRTQGPGAPPFWGTIGEIERATEDDQLRITEDGTQRILES
jgi:hypothetical protein